MLNERGVIDYRQALTGKDGRLYIADRQGRNIFMGEVDNFSVKMNIATTDLQLVGDMLKRQIPTGISLTLTFSEVAIRDDLIIMPILADISEGFFPYYSFQGMLRGHNGQYSRLPLEGCMPTGDIDLMTISPGEIVRRNWSFSINEMPRLIENFYRI
jgi:hypothetical protein